MSTIAINWEVADVLLIHNCRWGKFKGNKLKNKNELPSKCLSNLCYFYATWYGTCTKTGDACTRCKGLSTKSNGISHSYKNGKRRPSSISVGDSITHVNAYGNKIEYIVTYESMDEVRYIEICNGREQIKSVARARFTDIKSKIKVRSKKL